MTARSKTERTNTDIEAFMRREKEKVAKTDASHDRPLGSRNQHYTIKVKNKTRFVDSDDEEEEEEEEQQRDWGEQTEKRYKKTREREAPLATKSKRHTVTTAMDDFFVVDELQQLSRRPVRSPQQQQQRRYDKLYRAEEAEEDVKLARLRIMNRHPLIRFYKLVAGAMQADLEDMFVHEDIEREVNRERRERLDATERAQQVEAIRASIAVREKKYEYLTRSEYTRLVNLRSLVADLVRLTGDYRRTSRDVGFYGLLSLADDYLLVFDTHEPPQQEAGQKRRKRELWRIIERNVDRKTLPRDAVTSYTYDDVQNLATFILLYRLVYDDDSDNNTACSSDEARPTLATYQCKRRDMEATYNEVHKEIEQQLLSRLVPQDRVEKGMRKAGRSDAYRAQIRELIASRRDAVTLNNLTKGDVPITQIHGEELNRRLSDGVTDTQEIIDRIIAYYEEKYDTSTSLVEKYEDAKLEGRATDALYADARKSLAGYFPALLNAYIAMYRNGISELILRILDAYVQPGMYLEPGTESGKQVRVMANTQSVLNVSVIAHVTQSIRVMEEETEREAGPTSTTTTTTTSNVKQERTEDLTTTEVSPVPALLAAVKPRDLIQDPMFMRYYNEGAARVFGTQHDDDDDDERGMVMDEAEEEVDTQYTTQTRFGDLESAVLGDDVKLASLARLFADYVEFVSAYIESLRLQMVRLEEQAERIATRGATTTTDAAAADEESDAQEEADVIERMLRRKRQKHASHAYFSAPLNSGIIEIKDDVEGKVIEAYQLVQEFCTGLQGLPLVAFKSDRALESGLASDFANFIAALFAAANILFPDSYKSKLAYDAIIMRKADMMERLKRYRYTRRYASSTPDAYTILVDNKTRRPPF
jgi:hypothetical protein